MKKILGLLLATIVCIGGCNSCSKDKEINQEDTKTNIELATEDNTNETDNINVEEENKINEYDEYFKNTFSSVIDYYYEYENATNKELIQQCIDYYNANYDNLSDEIKNKYNNKINKLNEDKYKYEQKQQDLEKQKQIEESNNNSNNSTSNDKSSVVYITPKGKKYHSRPSCRTIKNGCSEISIDNAENCGYDPCKVCN